MENNEEKKNPIMEQYPQAPQLDLSKIKNLKASAQADDGKFTKEIEKKTKEANIRNVKNKFNFTEEYDIMLPSKGRFYQNCDDENVKKGIITVRPMSIAEEEIMANKAYINNGSMFRRVYDACITSNFQAKDLISYDGSYLMYALRNVSYGDDYTFSCKCPSCGKEYDVTINIEDIPWEEIPSDVEEKRTLKFPVSKFTAVMGIGRLSDEEEFIRVRKTKPDVSELVLGYVVKTKELYDENGDPVNPSDWIDFYSVLPVKDRAVITKAYARDGDLPLIDVECPKCGEAEKIDIPWQDDFFRA